MKDAVAGNIKLCTLELEIGEEEPKRFKFLDWINKWPTQMLLVALDVQYTNIVESVFCD